MNALEIWEGKPPSDWDEMVCRHNGTIFQSSHWAEYQSHIQNAYPVFIFSKEEGNQNGAGAVALFRKSRLPIVTNFLRELVLLSHPFRENDNAQAGQNFFKRCEELGRQWGCSRVSLESFYSGNSPFVPGEQGYKETRRVEFSVDLLQDNSTLWQGIKKDQRERIRKLEREGVVISEGTNLEDLRELHLVREATQGKRAQKGQHYSLSSDENMYQQLERYVMKQGIGRVFLARQNNEIIAGIFYATFNKKAYSVFSGSTQAGYKLSAQSGLFWGALKQFQAEGFHELNRGGVPESASMEQDPLHGIYKFKKRLGTTPVTCRSGIKVLSPLKETLSNVWERIRDLQ